MPKRLLLVAAGIITLNLSAVTPALAAGNNQQNNGSIDRNTGKAGKPQQAVDYSWSEDQKSRSASKTESQTKADTKTAKRGPAVSQSKSSLTASPSAMHSPPGNNGTVKIDAQPFDSHPDNQPHVGCKFQVDLYNYDMGDHYADLVFSAHPSTGSGTILSDRVFIGNDAAGGGRDLDAAVTYDLTSALSGITPHPKQGYHVKLTVHAEGSIGADTKHKVFWVKACGSPGKGGGFISTTAKIYSGMGGGLSVRSDSPTIIQAASGALPNTGSMLDLFLAAIGALGFAAAARVRESKRAQKDLH